MEEPPPAPGPCVIVDLATPSRRAARVRPWLQEQRSCEAASVDGGGTQSVESEAPGPAEGDADYSPRFPEEWQPLEYELLEYADALPKGFADRVGCEIEVQERTVAQLRALNAQLLEKEEAAVACQSAEGAGGEAGPPGPAAAPAPPSAPAAAPAKAGAGCAAAAAEAQRRAQLAESARQLEQKARQVRRAAEKELLVLAARLRACEEQQRQLAREATEDAVERKRLWEAEADMLRLRCRQQQLEAARRHAERRADQRESEDKQLDADILYLREEVQNFRARVPEYDAMEQREEDLRRELRVAKLQLRALQRCQAAAAAAAAVPGQASLPTPASPTQSPREQRPRKNPLLVRPSLAKSPGAGTAPAGAGSRHRTSPRASAGGA